MFPRGSHLQFIQLFSMNRPSILLGISSWIYTIIPPPFLFRSNLNGSGKPFLKSCEVGNESSSFVSVITRTSVCFITSSFNCLNLFGSELIFILPMITLFVFLNRRFLNSDKGSRDASFMDLSDLSLKSFSSAKLSELDCFCNHSQNKQNLCFP